MTWQPRQPMDFTICSPRVASPRGGLAIRGLKSVSFAKSYATVALISASFLAASSGELEFELYQTRGIQVVGLTAFGLRIQVLTQSSDSFEPICVSVGPGLRRFSNPLVLWHA